MPIVLRVSSPASHTVLFQRCYWQQVRFIGDVSESEGLSSAACSHLSHPVLFNMQLSLTPLCPGDTKQWVVLCDADTDV